jgi:hypothetical protein
MLKNLWNDEVGALLSAEFILLATILVIGAIVGLKAVQEAIVTELADVAQAVANVNQSYSWSATTGHSSSTSGSIYSDARDFCDDFGGNADGNNGKCVNLGGNAPPAAGG